LISSFMNSVSSVVRRFGRRRATVLLFVGLIVGSACRQDMHNQPKYRPLRESAFFGDQLSSRPFVPDTIARGELRDDQLLYTGKVDGNDALLFPFQIDESVMKRGQERFNIYCSPCHGRTDR